MGKFTRFQLTQIVADMLTNVTFSVKQVAPTVLKCRFVEASEPQEFEIVVRIPRQDEATEVAVKESSEKKPGSSGSTDKSLDDLLRKVDARLEDANPS